MNLKQSGLLDLERSDVYCLEINFHKHLTGLGFGNHVTVSGCFRLIVILQLDPRLSPGRL